MSRKFYYNGTILTVAEDIAQAKAVLIEDGIIKKVFPENAEISEEEVKGATKIDLQEKVLVPGFIDGHSHFLQNILVQRQLNASPSPLGEADSLEELIKSLKNQAEDPKFKDQEYLFARGYDEAVYPEHRIPTRYDLDQVTGKPLALTHVSGHNTVFNSAALALAGIDDDYLPPEGGSVGRFPDGKLNGIFHENARKDALPKATGNDKDIMEKEIEKVVREYASVGVTTAQDGGTSYEWYTYATELADAGKLPIDVASYLLGADVEKALTAKEPWESKYKNHYRAAGLKVFLDGSPQAKTAWLSKPYKVPPANVEPDYRGYGIYTDEALEEILKNAVEHHWQINVHTNGDEAIEQLIRVYGKVVEETGVKTDLRPVSIHCQTVREDQLVRMKELGMIASFFVDHTYYWGDYHEASVLGTERARRISPLAEALKYNISFSLHQDTPVTPQNPIFAIHNAVNRKTRSGKVLGEEYRITPLEALRAVTLHGAYQLFEEKEKGSIEAGKKADFVILSDNPLTVDKDKIKDIYVLETIKDGEVIYQR